MLGRANIIEDDESYRGAPFVRMPSRGHS